MIAPRSDRSSSSEGKGQSFDRFVKHRSSPRGRPRCSYPRCSRQNGPARPTETPLADHVCTRRPTMRFVRIKSAEQQGQLMQHRTRDVLIRQRTQIINALRAYLAELGIVAAQGDAGSTNCARSWPTLCRSMRGRASLCWRRSSRKYPMTANGSKNRCMTSVLAIGRCIGRRSRCVMGHVFPLSGRNCAQWPDCGRNLEEGCVLLCSDIYWRECQRRNVPFLP